MNKSNIRNSRRSLFSCQSSTKSLESQGWLPCRCRYRYCCRCRCYALQHLGEKAFPGRKTALETICFHLTRQSRGVPSKKKLGRKARKESCLTKVGQLYGPATVEKDVLQLDITVRNPLAVQELKSIDLK